MTFRVPLTSSGVDTAAAGQAGVKVYEGSDPATGSTFGVVEFRDGFRNDAPAKVIGRAYTGRSEFTASTGGLQLVGGSYNAVTAPELDLNVETDGAGLWFPVARLKGGQLAPQATAYVGAWANGFRDWPGGLERPLFTAYADGLVTFTGLAQNNSGAARGGTGTSTQIAVIPAGFVPPVTAIRVALANASVNCRVDFASDGHIYLTDCPVIPAGSQLVFGVVYRLDSPASA